MANEEASNQNVTTIAELDEWIEHEGIRRFKIGVFDISDSFRAGKQELKLDILPAAQALGLTLDDLSKQVRQAFYGEEAQRIQRGRDDIRVMVRYPEEARRSLSDLEDLRIRTPDGGEVPLPAHHGIEYRHHFLPLVFPVNHTHGIDQKIIFLRHILKERNQLVFGIQPPTLGDFKALKQIGRSVPSRNEGREHLGKRLGFLQLPLCALLPGMRTQPHADHE